MKFSLTAFTLIFIVPNLALAQSWHGTPVRIEYELKKSYLVPNGFEQEKIFKGVVNQAARLITQKRLRLPSITHQNYRIEQKEQCSIYHDYYLDDEADNLAKDQIAYRLRYRYKNQWHYKMHRLFPFLPMFYPIRFEIQSKTDYKFSGNAVTVNETRFEFRNDSAPFNIKKDAPPPPWQLKRYLPVAQRGLYGGLIISPYLALQNKKNQLGPLKVKMDYITKRCRAHVTMKNPWGKLPNPDQMIIISVDQILTDTRHQLLAVELELDRSFISGVNEKITQIQDPSLQPQQLKNHLIKFSQDALNVAFADYQEIAKGIFAYLDKNFMPEVRVHSPKYIKVKELIDEK